MKEIILNIYLIIERDHIVAFRAKSYLVDGSDEEKILFLKSRAKQDFESAEIFDAPRDKNSQFIPYKKFSRLELQGMHYQLFESIFVTYNVPQNPLVCVTPVVDGMILSD